MDYQFVEIGTSDFDTLIEGAPDDIPGLSIEPLKYYLDRLPTRRGCQKGNFAVSDRDGEITIYWVRPEDIEKWGLPGWVRGCNSVGAPHPTVKSLLQNMGLVEELVITKETVAVKSFETLVKDYNIGSIGMLKIDTEGHDVVILRSYLKSCVKNPSLFANTIIFESNCLSKATEVNDIILAFATYGYTAESIADSNTRLSRQR